MTVRELVRTMPASERWGAVCFALVAPLLLCAVMAAVR